MVRHYKPKDTSDKPLKTTFFTKNDIECPVCGNLFKREEMFTGRGRLVAGNVSEELRRIWMPGKWGLINPLLYPITVCPKCYFAVMSEDFLRIKAAKIEMAKSETERRQATIKKLFGFLDFTMNRQIEHGAASYLLAVQSYNYMDRYISPTIKKAICSLRSAWLFSDMENEYPDKEFGNVALLFYRKALGFYHDALNRSSRAEESFDGVKSFGPDTDTNFGYDGVLYLIGYLTLKLGYLTSDIAKRKNDYESAKRYISKMFGSGKYDKNKPSLLLDMTRDLYDELGEKIEEFESQMTVSSEPSNEQASKT